jgi:AcrR family transcriptional regulator
LKVSAELFSARGYAATTTRMIADGVGLRQASLFHYFDRKEEILAELLDRTVRPALAFSAWIDSGVDASAVTLHALSWWDSHNLCSRPDNLAGLQLLHEARDERFSKFWKDRELLIERYRVAIVATRGAQESDALITTLVFGLVESVLMWFDRDGAPRPTDVASAIARAVLGIAGVDASAIVAIEDESAALRDRFIAEISGDETGSP